MESSNSDDFRNPVLIVLYDFRYLWKDKREIVVKKGEKLLLLEKTNKDWWQVVRPIERKSFFIPAQYVEVIGRERPEINLAGTSSSEDYDLVLYENLEGLKQQANFDFPNIPSFQKPQESSKVCKEEKIARKLTEDTSKQKPVPKTRTKVANIKSKHQSGENSDVINFDTSEKTQLHTYKCNKSDNLKFNRKISQDLIFSSQKESLSLSALQSNVKNYSGESAPVAVENLVYCNVPLGESKNFLTKHRVQPSDIQNKVNIDPGKNRMKNSYNLKSSPFNNSEFQKTKTPALTVGKQGPITLKKEKSKLNHTFSKSLEKLAEEIQFEPKKVNVGVKSLSADNYSKSKSTKMPKDSFEKEEKRGKTNDASVVLDEVKVQPQSRSMFSRFRRSLHHSSSFKSNNLKKLSKSSKKACEISLSWEGGLDKIQEKKENEEKLQVTPLGLQRSRTFMFAERSPLSIRPASKMFSVKHRLDTAYHSQRKPEQKVTLSTFKPIFNVDVANNKSPNFAQNQAKEFTVQSSIEEDKLHSNVLRPLQSKVSEVILEKKEVDSKSKSESECYKPAKTSENSTSYENVTKVHSNAPDTGFDVRNKASGPKGLSFCQEPYSNSESEDNLEEKSLTSIVNKSLKSQTSVESNVTVSEGTEVSESDDCDSLSFKINHGDHGDHRSSNQFINKRRTSLVRSTRVESSKARRVTSKLPPTPPSGQKPLKVLGGGWGAYFSNGRSYYYNEITGEKNWKPPRKTMLSEEKRLVGSHESLSSDINRSNTSSPFNENCQFLNAMSRSTGSLKSPNSDSASFEIQNSAINWKEDSPDDLNRSSYNSSPVAGLSQSSTYSFNRSSRDSLNRFSPIENIPSEEEGLELKDHVYQDDISNSSKEDLLKLEGDRKHKSTDRIDTSMFHVKPGWEEFYDENLDQIYYTYKDKKEKWILSFDSEERAYFFEETSKKSSWALPDYSGENTRPEHNYFIQRSATESAISNETPTKLRFNKDESQARVSASTRSSKAQSMLIEPKLVISPKDENKTFSMPRDLSKIYGEIIRIGILNKTKILENGKKLKKNWTPSFIVLTDSYLFFFKDAKSFQNMKNVIGSNGNHMCLSLQGAVIEKGEKISSRKNVYRISCSDNTDVLIQSDKTSDAEEWFKEISSIIQKLPENPSVRSSSLLDSKSPSRVGRTKSLKVRSKDTGSMEDLSSTPEERQNKIKARLKKFFIRRPTVDSLKKKGIWKDEPVFGCSLEQITKNRNPRVPVFVEKCIECIESKEENMKTDGLYRASGNLSQVQKIRLEVDQNNLNIIKEEEDVHVLTGSLKLFFRELKEPLIPSKQLEPALLATDKHSRKERIKDFQKIVKNLPTPNYDTLKFLLQHLLRVKEYHKFNRMNINNLAIVFGPTLMWPEQESANMALELMQQNVVIECLLKEFQEIFS